MKSGTEWDRLWQDVTLLTMVGGDQPYGMIADGAIAVHAGRIDWIGRAQDLPALSADVEVISAGGSYLTPGLIDCHTHLVYGGSRVMEFEQRLHGASYADIARDGGGILSTVRATRAASAADLYDLAKKRLTRLCHSGVTTVEIKSGYGLDIETELKMLRVARKLGSGADVDVVTTFLGAHALPPEFAGDADGYLNYVSTDMLDAVVRENLADAVDGFCEEIAFSADQLEDLLSRAGEHGLDIKLHADQLTNGGGATLAAQYRALSADHLEYIDEDGVRAMAASGTVAVLLPGAFYSLRDDHC
ncbi:MAG: imidazolonepropionase, partial [Alphaproteobacteria bacterium]|nr:imidazolonepropionase [Alphaproteobacteria bacterium]